MKNSYARSISLQCPTCGGENFEFSEDKPDIRCVRCDRVMTKDELKEVNGARVEAEFDEIKSEVMEDVRSDFAGIFKKWK